MADDISISIDADNKIRTLPAESFREAEQLEEQIQGFVEKMETFSNTVQSLIDITAAQAAQIEKEKLNAVGQRLKVQMETDNRKRRQHQLQILIREKEATLERLAINYASLEKVEKEQLSIIEKLSNNEA
uniref:Intraflagellar transport protein 20 n=1 Tax=Chromera velia CCMP2878 TaxID=1169474 RepID=A0A0G4I3A3_9ALVE|mmetsp:Transcript_52562/g.102804  ORF Transcript_52562/g.102804 Transcript_52562/m.102804 type:complete len:130 (-) Transcript_52562:124-513(-)|eukprot:Cvel_10601.t1-p1 / transcript=Cvel_10601.t1 / gene=Cvel_10601 / organism=Chromera_velia_CCMP2878 / gene_product=Intraflagellar transport protein 20 homolog, putative / transcript_product=Intraflagellar transport protein 20 homolog, putative / location=Cvel_scaffold643:15595-17870(+) / protein_length=129 / sequence_SO=supercontig / SO=protein_coding / is_pseudo=false